MVAPRGDWISCSRRIVVVFALLLNGCATALPDDRLTPRPVTTEIPVLSWPMVALTIVDDRPNAQVAHEALVTAVVASPADTAAFRLTVTVVRHEVAFAGGRSPWWTGTTELRALLGTSGGETIASWRVVDTSQEWNAWGYRSGSEAAQDSLTDGLRTLLRRMAAQVQFGQVYPSGAVILRPSSPGTGDESEPAAKPAAPPSDILCRQRADWALGGRDRWLEEYRRCLAGK